MAAAPQVEHPLRAHRKGVARMWRRSLLAAAAASSLAACSLAPVYQPPALAPAPAAWKEGNDLWKSAAPADASDHGQWWKEFGDARLDALESRLEEANPTLAVALARYERAAAYAGEAASALSPQVDLLGSPTRNRQSDNRPLRGSNQPDVYDADTLQASINYELDFWGRVRNEVAAGQAEATAANADLATARLSLEARLASLYFQLAGDDMQARILHDAVDAYRQAQTLTQNRFEGGVDSELAVARARTQLSDALSQAAEVDVQRALTEHAIASLVGETATSFSLPPDTHEPQLPDIPAGVPSALLQRRPDIAAAERRVFAANAGIGIARAAFYPDFTLSGLLGWQDTGHGNLFSAGNQIWALGPLAALNLLDGGRRRAQEREARAAFDEASGRYRATVLDAFQQVEDNLATLEHLRVEARNEDDAEVSAKEAADIATNRYREGAVNYLDVVVAQTSYLTAQRAAQSVRVRRLQASVQLIEALGGGWKTSGTSGA